MSGRPGNREGQERATAALLRYGTLLASGIVGAGLAVQWRHPLAEVSLPGLSGFGLVKTGVALFILLPVSRVVLMLVLFLQERDAAYMAISALVLLIIGAGFLAGL